MTPLLSIIIPCYNHGHYIQDAIESIQSYNGDIQYEVIIVNDGSDSEVTMKILEELKEKGFKIYDQINKGLAEARNIGISLAKGKYVIPLDADNKIRHDMITEGIAALKKDEKIDIVYGDVQYFGEQTHVFRPGKFSFRKLLIENYIDACILMKKAAWERLGGYDKDLNPYEDWDLNIRAAALGCKFYYIPKILFDYRVRNDSMLRFHKSLDEIKNKLAKKHGILYKEQFLKTIRIKERVKSLVLDVLRKLSGNPIQ